MKNLLRPSLVRRVVLSLLIGILLAWAAFVGLNFLRIQAQQEDDRQNFAASPVGVQMLDALAGVDDATQAGAIAAAFDRIASRQRERRHFPGNAVMQLWDRREQRIVYSSAAAADDVLHGNPASRSEQILNGQPYQVFEVDTNRWSVLWARSLIDNPWVLKELGVESITNIAIAIPCLLLPVWLAVFQGLRPLRQFSARIAARGPDDMSPVGLVPQQAEMKPLAAALDALLTTLRQKSEAEQLFAANAAHELRTPLAVVTAQAHVLAKATTVEGRLEAEQRLEAAVNRASHLIHQLLVLARMDMDRSPGSTTVDLAQLAREEISSFVPAASARNMDIALEAPDRLMATLDTQSLRSILQNLTDNAIRYGVRSGRVVVKLFTLDGAIVLSVIDDGPGIAESDHSQIFDRFYRGANPPDAQGTGLGLTIVKVASARMGGEVQITEGLDGRGCCFALKIPISNVELNG
jgi:two-component system, OmpR family, sensor histidine kinase QseC